jgi:quaternary ammonium compound-resistance protein SugE
MSWTYLVVVGRLEVFFAFCLKAFESFSRIWLVIGSVLGAMISLYFLSKAMQPMPRGTAYAVWTGIRVVGTVILGILIYRDPVNFWRLFFISTLVLSIIGLKFLQVPEHYKYIKGVSTLDGRIKNSYTCNY